MAWYNNGNWEGLSLSELMGCVRELMIAVNEREHAIGKRDGDTTGFLASHYLAGISNPYFQSVYEMEGENQYTESWLSEGGTSKVRNINGYTKWLCFAEGSANTLPSGEKEFDGLIEKSFPEMADFEGVEYPLFFQENLRRLCHALTSVYLKQDGVSYHQTWMHMLTCANKIECEDGSTIYSILTDKDESIWDTVLGGLGFVSFVHSWPDRRELMGKPSGACPSDVKWEWMDYQSMLAWPWTGEIQTVDPSPFLEIRNVLDKMKYIQTVVDFPEIGTKGQGKVAVLPLVETSGGDPEYPEGEDCAGDYAALKTTFEALPLVPVYSDSAEIPRGTASSISAGDSTITVTDSGVSGRDAFPEEVPFYIVAVGVVGSEIIKVVELNSGGSWEVERSLGVDFVGTVNISYLNPVPSITSNTHCYTNKIEVAMSGGYPENLFAGGYKDKVRMVITQFYSGKRSFNVEDISKMGGQLKYIKSDYHAECRRPHTATLELSASGDWASMMFGSTQYMEVSESISETIPYIGCVNDDSTLDCSLDLQSHVLDMPSNLEMTTREVQPIVKIFRQDFEEERESFLTNSRAETTGGWEKKGTNGVLTRDASLEISGSYSWKFVAYTPYFQGIFGQTVANRFYRRRGWYRIRVQHKGAAFKFGLTNSDRSSWDAYYSGTIMDCPASASAIVTEKLVYIDVADADPSAWAEWIAFFSVPVGMTAKTIWVDGVQCFKVHGNDFLGEHSDSISGVNNSELSGGITLPFPEPAVDSINYQDPSEEVFSLPDFHPYTGAMLSNSNPYYCTFKRGTLGQIADEGGTVTIQTNLKLPTNAAVASIPGHFLIKPVYDTNALNHEYYGSLVSSWGFYNPIYSGGLGEIGSLKSYYNGAVWSHMEWDYAYLDWHLLFGNETSGWMQNKADIKFWYKAELDSGEDETQTAYIASFLGSLLVGRQLKLLYDLSSILTYG